MQTDARHLSDEELLLTAESRGVHAHLASCESCQRRLAEIERRLAEAIAVCRDDTKCADDHTSRMRTRLQAELGSIASVRDDSWRGRFASSVTRLPVWIPVAAGFAATLLIALIVGLVPVYRPSSVVPVEADARPIRSLTPGAVRPVSLDVLCSGGAVDLQEVADATRHDVVRAYGMERVPSDEYELDYLITPELGGATDARNLWPERYGAQVWNARVKDQLEELLPRLVCAHRVTLETAQRDIATDWVAAYKKYFRTNVPLPARLGRSRDPRLVIAAWQAFPLVPFRLLDQ
jgi:hypothetical protein